MRRVVENEGRTHDAAVMENPLESMARTLVESGQYRVSSRLQTPAEYHPPDSSPAVASLLGSMTPANRPRKWRQTPLPTTAINAVRYRPEGDQAGMRTIIAAKHRRSNFVELHASFFTRT
jgi:hypothetical protein